MRQSGGRGSKLRTSTHAFLDEAVCHLFRGHLTEANFDGLVSRFAGIALGLGVGAVDAEVEGSRARVRCSIPEPCNLAEEEEIDLICLPQSDRARDGPGVYVEDWRGDRLPFTLGNLNRAYLRRGAGSVML
jgi:hypothetical protein